MTSEAFGIPNLFQSTHPRGVRQDGDILLVVVDYFNPRTHVGCDLLLPFNHFVYSISIHAPTWGATQIWKRIYNIS